MSATTRDIPAVRRSPRGPAPPSPALPLPAAAVMSTPILAVAAPTPIGDILQVMLRLGRHHVVVVAPDGRCLGVLGDRAVAAAWASDPSALSRVRAGQLVATAAGIVGEQTTIQDVAALMIRERTDAVAVVDPAGQPVGIITGSDLLGLLARTCWPGPTATAPVIE